MNIHEHKLSAQARKNLPAKSFVFPKQRKYPIEDKPHARNALARVSQHGSPAQKAKVRSAVHSKYPDIGESQRISVLATKIVDSLLEFCDDEGMYGEECPQCPACGGEGHPLGALGRRMHYRCRHCGMDFSRDETQEPPPAAPPKANIMPGGSMGPVGDTTAIGIPGGGN